MLESITLKQKISLAITIILCFLIYTPGIYGGWVFDDFHNIVKNQDIQAVQSWEWLAIWDAAWSSNAGIFKRPLSMLTFSLNHAAFGMNPFYFKIINVFIHLINGIIIFFLTKYIVGYTTEPNNKNIILLQWMPILVTAFWLIHPLQMSSVLYVVQRMNSLCATFIFLGLAFYTKGRINILKNKSKGQFLIITAFLACLPLAALSKENGVLLAPLILVLEVFIFRFQTNTRTSKFFLYSVLSIFVFLPAVFIIYLLIQDSSFLIRGFGGRDFTLDERLLTQTRLLFIYASWILFPRLSQLGLYHDDIPTSLSVFNPITTLFSASCIILIFVFLIYNATFYRKKIFWLSLGIGFYLVGHSMESSFLPLEMVHEHRNYIPSYGLFFIISFFILKTLSILKNKSLLQAADTLIVLMLLFVGFNTWQRAQDWSNPIRQSAIDAMNHPNSPRSQVAYANWLEYLATSEENSEKQDNYLRQALDRYKHAHKYENYALTPLINTIRLERKIGEEDHVFTLLKEVEEKLSRPPLSPATTEAVIDFIECNSIGQCSFTEEEILKIVYSIRKNPRLNKTQEARVISQLVNYLIRKNRFGAALAFSEEARNLVPHDIQVRINFAILLYKSGFLDASQQEIRFIETMPMTSNEKNRFISLKEDLAKE